jgi:twitching motility protein PilT
MARIDAFLKLIVEQQASDLHLVAGSPPVIRVNGDLFPVKFRRMSRSDCENFFDEILTEKLKEEFRRYREIDFAYTIEDVARFRVNMFEHREGVGAVFRVIPNRIQTLAELNLPASLRRFALADKGLVLITGPTGSGKSTTLAAIIDVINTERKRHILTIEDPIEFVHTRKQSLISQRQVGRHTATFTTALRAASRGAADVILIGEMRDIETISMALTCAETGSLVFGTLHTTSAAKAITRIIDAFPSDRQGQVRTMLSMSLRGLAAQILVKRVGGRGRVPVVEILTGSPALANLIREAKIHQIPAHIETADTAKTGMQSMDQALLQLVKDRVITPETAIAHARDITRFRNYLEGENIAA